MAIVSQKERRLLVIDGEVTRVIRETIEREVKTSDFEQEVAKNVPLLSGPLPAGCVYYARSTGANNVVHLFYLLELPAHVQKVIWKKPPETEDEERHPEKCFTENMLSWPNTLWAFVFGAKAFKSVSLVATKSRFIEKGVDTPIYIMPMPNQYDGGHGAFCTGNLTADMSMAIEARAEKILRDLLTSAWNTDLPPDFTGVGVDNILDWAKKTSKNAELHNDLKLRDHRLRTVKGLFNHLGLRLE